MNKLLNMNKPCKISVITEFCINCAKDLKGMCTLACVCVPFMKPQTLPGCQGLCRVLQHPQFVEQHHVEEHQQDQAEGGQEGKEDSQQ